MSTRPLDHSFYHRPVVTVAKELVGCRLVFGKQAGIIVETEAYHQIEPACHAYIGRTSRTATLFGSPGTTYVYRSYGIHNLFNVVCEDVDVGAAVLVRALEPIEGIDEMKARRGRDRVAELCSGPGKLTQALGINLSHNDSSVIDGEIKIYDRHNSLREDELHIVPRVGITRATELLWRFCLANSPFVSRPRPRVVTLSNH